MPVFTLLFRLHFPNTELMVFFYLKRPSSTIDNRSRRSLKQFLPSNILGEVNKRAIDCGKCTSCRYGLWIFITVRRGAQRNNVRQWHIVRCVKLFLKRNNIKTEVVRFFFLGSFFLSKWRGIISIFSKKRKVSPLALQTMSFSLPLCSYQLPLDSTMPSKIEKVRTKKTSSWLEDPCRLFRSLCLFFPVLYLPSRYWAHRRRFIPIIRCIGGFPSGSSCRLLEQLIFLFLSFINLKSLVSFR